MQQIRPGGSVVLDQVFTGGALKSWELSVKRELSASLRELPRA